VTYCGAIAGHLDRRPGILPALAGFTASRSNSGFAGGGKIGCDYQMGAWVVGILGFGTNSSSAIACGGACILSGKADLQNVLVGLNYKF
jgi:hypothetical protein